MAQKPETLLEKRAVKFAVDLRNKFGYGNTVSVPIYRLRDELRENGMQISHPTLMGYWRALVRMGYAKREMRARVLGVTYRLNTYSLDKLSKAV